MKELLLKFITLLHLLFIIFIIVTPFLNSNYLLLLHAIFVPFMVLHWICNDNTCILTVVERKLRKDIYGTFDKDDCITCRLIEPVYDFRKNHQGFTTIIYVVTFILWSISVGRLYSKFQSGEIKNFRELFAV